MVTSDPKLFERAFRFHDVGMLRSPYTEALGGGLLAAFAACNFRMNEFTGAVLCGQLEEAGDHLHGRSPQCAKSAGGNRGSSGPQTAKVAGPRRRVGRRSLPGPGYRASAAISSSSPGRRGNLGLAARRIGGPSHRRTDRKEGYGPPRLAFLPESRRQGDPLRPRVLPTDYRHPRSPCRCDDGPHVPRGRCEGRYPGGPEGLPGHASGISTDFSMAIATAVIFRAVVGVKGG